MTDLTPRAPVEDDLWAVVDSFTLLRTKLFLDGAMSHRALASALETFKGLTQEQLGLLLAYGLEGAGGGGPIPDPLTLGTFIATTQVQAPNGTVVIPGLQVGAGSYGFYRVGTSLVVSIGGVAPVQFTPTGMQLGMAMNASLQPITNVPDPTAATGAANMRWCLATFAPIVEFDVLRSRISALEARLAALEARLGP